MSESESLESLAPDLTKEFPRSPRVRLEGCDYVVAARTLDKCRAALVEKNGEYHFDCPLDNFFLEFAEISADAFKEYVATGASDADVGQWIMRTAKAHDRTDIIVWNNSMRFKRISEMPPELQLFLEDYIPEVIPADRIADVNYWFDVYDIEEKRK